MLFGKHRIVHHVNPSMTPTESKLGDMNCHEEGSVVWGALEEGVVANSHEHDLLSWSREATSLWHDKDNSWCVGL
jgi:hypothetical protein